MMGERFIVVAIDGEFLDFMEPGTPYLRFDALTWEETVTLCRLCFSQDFQCVLMRQEKPDKDADHGAV